MKPIQKDSTLAVESYKIKDFKTVKTLTKDIICIMKLQWILPAEIRPFQQGIIWFPQNSLV